MKKQFIILLILVFALVLVPINFIKNVRASTIFTPIAYYDFNDEDSINTGVVNDKIGNYIGQNYNGVWTSNGYDGGAMIFDCARGDYGMKTAFLPALKSFTVSYRIKLTPGGTVQYITSVPVAHFSFHIDYGNFENLNIGENLHISAEGVNYKNIDARVNTGDNWEYLAVVYDGSGFYFYNNGVEVEHSKLIQSYIGNVLGSSQWIFGGAPGGCGSGDKLQLDEIKIYNVALTADQILKEYNNIDVWECGDWEICSAGGEQTRVCTKTYNSGLANTPPPITTQSCTYIPSCTSDNWNCTDWSSCSVNGAQSRTCNKTSNCQGGISSPITSQSCTYIAPVPSCISFNYSSWSQCTPDGKQTRDVTSKYPSNCEGGESPKTTQSCTYSPPAPSCTTDTWTCDTWSSCSLSGIQNRSCTKTFDCPNVQTAPPTTDQYCEAPSRPQQTPPSSTDEILNQDSIIKSSVKLVCPVDAQRASQGSGTVIDPSGIILTNKHVIAGTLGCIVGFINDFNDEPYFGERQIADIFKLSSNQDVAILKIRNPKNTRLSYVDITKSSVNFPLGTKITTYGYPAKFGTNITYTSGDFSGTDGSYLKTTAILEYGNSGGGAYLKNGAFIGIPSAVVKGQLNAMGYLLSINTINSWLGNPSVGYGGTSNNNYSRVSALEDIDLKKLNSLKLFIPDTDAKGDLSNSVKNKAIQNSQNAKEQPQSSQTQKESTIIESTDANQKTNSEQRKSMVANAVQEMIEVAEHNGGIGQQIKTIAQTQTQNQEKLETGMQKIQSRGGFAKFFIGANYSEIKNSQKLLKQNKEQIQKLNDIRTKIVNQGDQLQVVEQIQALEQVNQQIETLLNESQKGFSLFGWAFKLFSR